MGIFKQVQIINQIFIIIAAGYAKNSLEKVRSVSFSHSVFSGQVVQYHFELRM